METERLVPCNYCRQKHLKCDSADPCTHCSRLQKDCVRTKRRYRFSKPKRLDASLGFSDNQTWVMTRNSGNLSFIGIDPQTARGQKRTRQSQTQEPDVEAEAEADRSPNDHNGSHEAISTRGMDEGNGTADAEVEVSMSGPSQSTLMPPPSYESLARQTPQVRNISAPVELQTSLTPTMSAPAYPDLSPIAHSDSPLDLMRALPQEWRQEDQSVAPSHWHGTHAMHVHHYAISPLDTVLQNRAPSTALRGLPGGFTDTAYLELQEACLIRHYVKHLSPGVRGPCNKSCVSFDTGVLLSLESY